MAYYRSRKSMFRAPNGLYYPTDNGTEIETDAETNEELEPTVSFNIPTFIRILEYVREEVATDDKLHVLVEKLIEAGADGDAIDMDDYEVIIKALTPPAPTYRRLRDGRRI
jgi:hypothetical protein